MSALDRAFIKAFAKDATREIASKAAAPENAVRAPAPAGGAELFAHDLEADRASEPVETIPLVRENSPVRESSLGRENHLAAGGAAVRERKLQATATRGKVLARPMTAADRRALEAAYADDYADPVESDSSHAILSIERSPSPGVAVEDSDDGSEGDVARTNDEAHASVPPPHFSISSAAARAASSEALKGATVRAPVAPASPRAGSLPPKLAMPSLPLPAARSPVGPSADDEAESQDFDSDHDNDIQGTATAEAPDEEIAEPAEEISSKSAFAPVWEVDRFVWPTVCDKLLDDWAPALEAVSESIDALVEEAQQRGGPDPQAPIIGVASFGRGEGRTTTAACLARFAARQGLKTVLIDGDFENPQLGGVLGLNSLAGWDDVMLAHLPLEEAGVLAIEDRFTLLPALRARPAAELYGGRKVHKALARIGSQFDLAVIDLGPIVEDVQGPYASIDNCPFDAVVLVRDLRWTTESQLAEAAGILESLETPILAVIENFAESRLPPRTDGRGPAKPTVIRE